jgi:predicted HAD superfamily Cof-like phosphohydrolase
MAATLTVPEVEDLRTLHAALSLAITLYDAVDEDGGVPSDAPLHGKRDRLVELARLLDHEANCPGPPPPATHPAQLDVAEFFQALDLPIGETPAIRNPQVNADLILEEARETAEAITGRRVHIRISRNRAKREQGLVGAIDGLCDQLATIYGAAVTFGVDLAPFWAEVHRTNMAKAGGPKRADGKQLKPEGWQPPDIAGLLARLHPELSKGAT